jgi:hypothetical protein
MIKKVKNEIKVQLYELVEEVALDWAVRIELRKRGIEERYREEVKEACKEGKEEEVIARLEGEASRRRIKIGSSYRYQDGEVVKVEEEVRGEDNEGRAIKLYYLSNGKWEVESAFYRRVEGVPYLTCI